MSYRHSQSVSRKVFWALVIVAVAITPSTVFAKEITVGDDKGWTLNFNYQGWVNGKTFHAGDKLVFNYHQGKHNVYKVNEQQFKSCDVGSGKGYFSGKDTITLGSGKSWYICGVVGHCMAGQKLVVNVK